MNKLLQKQRDANTLMLELGVIILINQKHRRHTSFATRQFYV